ncbi:hypothetical protein [Spirillospora sp. NPDC029432]|uniref:hypothetical protein n=1 Tax=Spirillospora sp. NPDC029432 TaxID=3154599 RepID=UPI003454F2DE
MSRGDLGGPIGDGQPYYEHVRRLRRIHGSGPLPQGGRPLPDGEEPPSRRTPERADVARLARLLSRWPLDRGLLATLDGMLRELDVSGGREELAAGIRALEHVPAERLRLLGRWLARTGTHAGAVDLGLILLGVAGGDDDRDLILALGSLERCCCCAADALVASQSRPHEALLEMARRSGGWARVDALRPLRGARVEPRDADWLIRDACDGGFLDVYFADVVAETGDLAGALGPEAVDDGLLDGAGRVLRALCELAWPSPGILDYRDAETAVRHYARHIAARPPTMDGLCRLVEVYAFLRSGRAGQGPWSAEGLARVRDLYRELLTSPEAQAIVAAGMASADPDEFNGAVWVADHVGLPVRDPLLRRLESDPLNRHAWCWLLDGGPAAGAAATAEDVGVALAAAERLLPLRRLMTGPSPPAGDADPYEDILDLVVSRLRAHPGHGWAIIRTALRNHVHAHRVMAVRALERWSPELFPEEALDVLESVHAAEPHAELRDDLAALITRAGPAT